MTEPKASPCSCKPKPFNGHWSGCPAAPAPSAALDLRDVLHMILAHAVGSNNIHTCVRRLTKIRGLANIGLSRPAPAPSAPESAEAWFLKNYPHVDPVIFIAQPSGKNMYIWDVLAHRHAALVAERDSLADVVGAALVAATLQAGEEIKDKPDHAIFHAVDNLRHRSEAAERDLSEAVTALRVLGEETVLAGFPGGDRDQTLANVRKMAGDLREARAYIKSLPANWHEDSSLKTWFPLTSEELERTKTEVAALRRLQGGDWVSVKERPELDKPVWAQARQIITSGLLSQFPQYCVARWHGDRWQANMLGLQWQEITTYKVTHWRELPAPPAAEPEACKQNPTGKHTFNPHDNGRGRCIWCGAAEPEREG